MPTTPTRELGSIFGTVIWGDFAHLTMYRRPDGRLVLFAKTYPDKPPSPDQLAQRATLTAAAAAWKSLDATKRRLWNQAASRASLCMHGYNLFVYWTLTADDAAIATLARQTATPIP